MFFVATSALQAADVSRVPPEVYATRVAPLLTPVETITAPRERKPDDNAAGVTLLDERIHIVDTEGRRVMVWHLAWKAFTDAGAKSIAEDVTSYLRKDQKYHLVTAETIQADGTVMAVRPNAVLVQSPQRQADYALYDDEEEVKVIFPNVKAGSITRIIAVIEDVNVRMIGEYAQTFAWSRNWELDRLHIVVELPAPLAQRAHVHTTGSDIPEMERSELEDGVVRYRWQAERLASRRYEPGRAPSSQVGPCVRISTIEKWDDVGRWFAGLITTRDKLSPKLAAQVESWTAGLTSREDIIRVLLAKVANDVRYTGLELGQAAYQPHDCNEVWENQYGDCKDKANLLVAFLRHKGIEARIALVNTYHLGLIDRRSPNYAVFSHAIVAIADGKSGYEFCDPTISFCEPGMIGPGSADRDVLVVEENGGKWMRTPVQQAGSVTYDFDLELGATGEISGWMSVTSEGSYGAGQREQYRRRDADETKRKLSDWVRAFYPSADVIDAVKASEDVTSGPDTVKAYFIVPAQRDQRDGRTTLRFPHGRWMLPDMGTTAQRESAFFLYQDRVVVRARIRLPEGLQLETRPDPYRFETPVGRARAHWEVSDGVVHAEIESVITQSAVGPQDFGTYYQAVQSMLAWLGQPVVLNTSSTTVVQKTTEPTIDLPLMPTGDGQLELVDRRFPYEGSHALRRAALERTLQYFPHDRKTVFNAHVRIGFLEWAADQNEAALNRVLPLLANYRTDVSTHDYAWAENLQALALRDLGRSDEALAILTRIARDPAMTAFRRSNTLISAADILIAENRTTEAIDLLAGGLDLDPNKRAITYQRYVRLLVEAGRLVRVEEALTDLTAKYPDVAEGVFVFLIQNALEWTGAGALDRMHNLSTIIRRAWPQPGAELASLLEDADKRKSTLVTAAAVQADLQTKLTQAPLDTLYKPVRDPGLKTWADFNRAIEEAEKVGDAERGTMLGVEAVVTLPVDTQFGDRLERATGQAEWWARKIGKEPPPAIFPVLLDVSEKMPITSDTYLEARFWRARWLARQGNGAGERKIYQDVLKIQGIKPVFRVVANARLGRSYENAGRFTAALGPYKRLEDDAPQFGLGVESMLRAVFINLHLKRADEALRVIQRLADMPEEVLKKASGETWIREFIALEKSGGAAAFWNARDAWWRRWNNLRSGQKLVKDGVSEVVPVIEDLEALKTKIEQAVTARDFTAFMENLLPVVSGARWLPSLTVEVAAMTDELAAFAPDKRNAVYEMAIAMLEIPVPETVMDPRRRPLQLAAHLIDDQKSQRALEVLATCRPEISKDRIDQTLLRLWAIAATASRREREECAAALEKSLADLKMPHLRTESVESLASLYRALGQGAKEKALLLREAGNTLSQDAEGKKRLEQRLAALEGSLKIAGQVETWINRAGLDWYAFAEPSSLADPRIGDLNTLLAAPEGRLAPVEIVKLRLLAAQDASRSVEAQQEAWCSALSDVVNWTSAQADLRNVLDPLLASEDIPVQVRVHALWLGLMRTADARNTVEFDRWYGHMLTRSMEPWRRDALPLLRALSRIPLGDAGKEHALLKEIVAGDIGLGQAYVMRCLAEALLMQGRTEEIEALVADVSGWRTLPHLHLSRERLQLELLQRVEQTKRYQPLYQALTATVLSEFSDKPRNAPRETKERVRQQWLEYTRIPSEESDWQIFFWLVNQGWVFDRWPAFWAQTARLHSGNPKYRELNLRLLETALRHAVDDVQRAEMIRVFALSADLDQPEVRGRLLTLLMPWRDAIAHPAASAEGRFLEVLIQLRTGQAVDLETTLAQINAPGIGLLRVALLQRHLVQTKDVAGLRRLLDGQSQTWLLDEKLMHQTLRQYELLDREREVGLVRQALRRELRRQVVRSWSGEAPFAWELAYFLTLALDEPDAIPQAWYAAMSGKVRGHDRVIIELLRARLAKDWDAVVACADECIRVAPAFYHAYWQKGYAAMKAGRTAEAREALKIYVQHGRDELEYPEALALLESIER